MKQFFLSSWLLENIDMNQLLTSQSLQTAIDKDQLDILTFLINDLNIFNYIIHLFIDIDGQYLNLVNGLLLFFV